MMSTFLQTVSADGGDILIEHLEQRKGQPSYVIVRDKAEGMDGKEMAEKLLEPGKYSSEAGDRGYMGRGAKDCSVLGDVLFESIKEDRYYKSKITQNLKFVLEVDGARATDAQRKQLGVSRGNADLVFFYLHKKMREFVSLAHAVMLKDDEVSTLKRAEGVDRAQTKRSDISQGSHVKAAVLGGN